MSNSERKFSTPSEINKDYPLLWIALGIRDPRVSPGGQETATQNTKTTGITMRARMLQTQLDPYATGSGAGTEPALKERR